MIIHATTDYAMPESHEWHMVHGKNCVECGCRISDRSTRCRRCNGKLKRTIKANRMRFAARAATLTRADILALTAAQMDRAGEKLGEWRGVAR